MRSALRNLSSFTRRLSALAFGLWLCGAGCVFCCVPAADAARERGSAANVVADVMLEGDASSAAHCPAHARRAPRTARVSDKVTIYAGTLPPADEQAGSCCARSRQASDPARKQRPVPERAAASLWASTHPDAAASAKGQTRARARSPDGRARHIRCCLFLI